MDLTFRKHQINVYNFGLDIGLDFCLVRKCIGIDVYALMFTLTNSKCLLIKMTHMILYLKSNVEALYNGPSILDNIFCKNKLESSYEKTLQFRF